MTKKRLALTLAGLCLPLCISAQTLLTVDAQTPPPPVHQGHLHMGTAVSPSGHRLEINSRYLTLDGKPWLPVMAEYHFSRGNAAQWETSLRKMKASGVDIVSTYVFWLHHEREPGRFDWRGDLDLRRFMQLAQRAGLQVFLRIGPWINGEARFGGVPDWVVQRMPTRSNDPEYLAAVERLYGEIGRQARGLMWKDGGPVVGVQFENEYNKTGPLQGEAHIAALKRLARAAGLDAPLYTVTGWDHAVYPVGEVAPVTAGYVDEPWSTPLQDLPPTWTSAFRFKSRLNVAIVEREGRPGTADADAASTPFIAAEYGTGLPAMYRRRPVAQPDDVTAMMTTQLGSGLNLVGYFMYHGGRNPTGWPTVESNHFSGAWNDTPIVNYDFQAPLGPDGQARPMLAALRPFNLLVQSFGERLAPMAAHAPDVLPQGNADLATPRWSVRSDGDAGFLFLNNHVRHHRMAAQPGVRFSVKLPGQTLVWPRRPVTVPAGGQLIWPFNFDMDGVNLVYGTAQPLARIDEGAKGVTYVFGATPGQPVDLAFAAQDAARVAAASGRAERDEQQRLVLEDVQPGTSVAASVARPGAGPVKLVVLTAEQAGQLHRVDLAGRPRLVLTPHQLWLDGPRLQLRALGDPEPRLAVFPALPQPLRAEGGAALATAADGVFQAWSARLPRHEPRVDITQVRAAGMVGPVPVLAHTGGAVQPYPEAFRNAATWRLTLPAKLPPQVDELLLEIDFVGDIGRLFAGDALADDWFYSGQPWQVAASRLAGRPLRLSVLPLRADAPIYLERGARPDFAGAPQLAQVRAVTARPVYRLALEAR